MKDKQPERNLVKNCDKFCGGCRWMTERYRGVNCVDTYAVTATSKACVEYEEPLDFSIIRKDPTISEIIAQVLSNKVYVIDETLFKELNFYYLSEIDIEKKGVSNIVWEDLNNDVILLNQLFAQVQGYRDRVVEIYLTYNRMAQRLEELRSKATSIILTRYYDLFQDFSSEAQRSDVIYNQLTEITSKQAIVEGIKESADTILDNLDKAHFTLCRMKELGSHIIYTKSGKTMQ